MVDEIETLLDRIRRFYSVEPQTGCWAWLKKSEEGGDDGERPKMLIKLGTLAAIDPVYYTEVLEEVQGDDQIMVGVEVVTVMWQLEKGGLRVGEVVQQRCKNPRCINPSHLRIDPSTVAYTPPVPQPKPTPPPPPPPPLPPAAEAPAAVTAVTAEPIRSDLLTDQVTVPASLRPPCADPPLHRNGQAKLTAAQVVEMRRLHVEEKFDAHQLADRFRVNRRTVQDILRNITWRHLPLTPHYYPTIPMPSRTPAQQAPPSS